MELLETKYPWFIFDFIIFLLLNVIVISLIYHRHLAIVLPSVWQMIILALAVFRLADIISNETITRPLRAPFIRYREKHHKQVEVPKSKGFEGAMGSLVYCPSCTGTWVAMALVYCNVFWPHITIIVAIIFALSGLERVLTSLINVLKKTPQVLDKIE